jgi:hypothetical protein
VHTQQKGFDSVILGGTIYLNKRIRLQSKSHSQQAAAQWLFYLMFHNFFRLFRLYSIQVAELFKLLVENIFYPGLVFWQRVPTS